MNVSVVTLGSGTWHLVDQIERQHGSVTVVRRCLDLSELLACAHTGMARVALVAEGAEELTASLLEQLALGSVRVLVVSGHDEHRLAGLGATIVPAEATAVEVIRLIEDAAQAPHPVTSHRGHSRTEEHVRPAAQDPSDALPDEGSPRATQDGGDVGGGHLPQTATTEGQIIAVWGPMGAPGRTVVALNLAAELAIAGNSVLLIDADTYAASVAASLGMLEEAAGLAQACRLADQGRLDAPGLQRCVTRVSVAGASLDVLTGLTRHDRWPEVRATALEKVLLRARASYGVVVIDTSFGLESDEEISVDVVAPRRNAATLTACATADTVVAVGAADVLGIPRLVKTLPDLLENAPDARVLVVINKLRKNAVGRSGQEAVTEAWERFSPSCGLHVTLDCDPQACDDSLLAGAVLAESAAKSTLRQQLAALATRALHTDDHAAMVGAAAGGAGPRTPAPSTKLGRRLGAWLRR